MWTHVLLMKACIMYLSATTLYSIWEIMWNVIFFEKNWAVILLFRIRGLFCIFALGKKSRKNPKCTSPWKAFIVPHISRSWLFFSALSLALPSCRRLQLRQPRWHVAPCPSRGWFFLHRKTQIQSQKTLGLPFCLYGVRLQSHQGRLGSATKYNIIRNTDIKRFLTTS